MYGVKFENDQIVIKEGENLDGYEMFETLTKAEVFGLNLEYKTLRKELNSMTLEELDSDRAKELEKRIWGRQYQDREYKEGFYIEQRKKTLR